MMITKDTRYWNPSYLNFSTLAKAISYDSFWNRMFNPLALYAPPMEQTDAMQIGTIVDEHFTESKDFYEIYTAVSRRSGDDPTQLTNTMYSAIDTVIKSVNSIPNLVDYLNTTNAQETLEDKTLQIKGKLDFYDPIKNHIIDMKVPGSIDNFLRDLYTFKDRTINMYHRYVFQTAWYSHLVEVNYGKYPTAELFAIWHNGTAIRINIPENTRRLAFAMLTEDINLIRNNDDMTYQITNTSASADGLESDTSIDEDFSFD